jgi:hypothetical protein|tara:strand:- start:684 stop:896 length:213 start_codon:yes stop_codon:yes gene_type:complete
MSKHFNRKFVNGVITTLKKNGFICVPLKSNKNKYSIKKNGGEIIVHSGMSCYHPLRRWLKSTYDFDLKDY